MHMPATLTAETILGMSIDSNDDNNPKDQDPSMMPQTTQYRTLQTTPEMCKWLIGYLRIDLCALLLEQRQIKESRGRNTHIGNHRLEFIAAELIEINKWLQQLEA